MSWKRWMLIGCMQSWAFIASATEPVTDSAASGNVAEIQLADNTLAAAGDVALFFGRDKKEKKAPTAKVPEGFEDLAGEQLTAVDVYYGGDYLLTALVEYTPETIEFLKPDAVLELIPDLIGRASLVDKLTGPLPRNSDLACFSVSEANCGRLQPDFIGVIFDENSFRVDLFIHKDLLEVKLVNDRKVLPDSSADSLGFLQNLAVAHSSSSVADDVTTLAGSTYLSKGRGRLASTWAHDNDGDNEIDTLSLQLDRNQYEYEAGYFRPRSGSLTFARTTDIVGVAFARSLKTRLDLEQVRGSLLQLYLPQRSQVDLFKDGRLYSSRVYEAGNQEIDTSRLPYGSYNLEIHIKDNTGSIEIVNRFFVKSARMPPEGEKLYYIETGRILERDPDGALPETQGDWTVRAGYQTRLAKNLGMNLGTATTDSAVMVEGAMNWLYPKIEFGIGGMASTQSDFGFGANLFRRWGKLSTSISGRRIWAHYEPLEASRFLLVQNDVSQFDFSASYPVWNGHLSHSRNISQFNGSENDIRSWRYHKPLYRWTGQTLFLNLEYTDTRDEKSYAAGLNIRFTGRHVSSSISAEQESVEQKPNDAESYTNYSTDLAWRDGEKWPEDLSVRGYYQSQRDLDEVGGDMRFASIYGIAEAEYADSEIDSGGSRQLTSLRYNTSFGSTEKRVGFGGQHYANTAVLLDIRSDTRDASFDVLVDGNRYAVARSGRKMMINLQPYRTYRIQVQDRGDVFVASTNRVYELTVYPGNVVPLVVDAPSIKIAFGRIVRNETVCAFTDSEECITVKTPVENGVIFGSHGYATTEDDGDFQAEVSYQTKHLLVRRHESGCIARMPENPEQQGDLLFLGSLDCEPTEARTLLEWYEANPEEDPQFDAKAALKKALDAIAEEEAAENASVELDDAEADAGQTPPSDDDSNPAQESAPADGDAETLSEPGENPASPDETPATMPAVELVQASLLSQLQARYAE